MTLFLSFFKELDSSQFVTTQSIHESTKRGNRQVIVVDAESRRQARQVRAPTSGIHGDVKVREATWASQEARGANAERSDTK